MCLCSRVGGQGVVLCGILKTTVTVARSWTDVLPPLAEKEGSVAVTRGGKVPRDRWAAGGERAGGLKREEKNREKLVRATTVGRQRREGIFAGRKEESAGGVGGRVEVGVWIVDGTGCTALRCAALHLSRNGRYGGRGVFWFEKEEAQIDQSMEHRTRVSYNGAEQRREVWRPKDDVLCWVCVRTSEQETCEMRAAPAVWGEGARYLGRRCKERAPAPTYLNVLNNLGSQILCPDAGPWDGPRVSLTLHGDDHTVPMEAEAALPRLRRAASPLRGTVRPKSGHPKTRPFFCPPPQA